MDIILINQNLLAVSKEMLEVITKADNLKLVEKAKKAIAEAEKVSVNEELANQVLGSIKDVAQTRAVQDMKGKVGERIIGFINKVITDVLSGKKR